MKPLDVKLGQILAYFKFEAMGNHKMENIIGLTETSAAYIHNLRRKKDKQPDRHVFPDPKTRPTPQFENDLEDYFITSLLNDGRSKPDARYCRQLYQSLNDSFLCFQSFTAVMKDYYHTAQLLSGRNKGKE